MMERFRFPADQQSVSIGRLSGGERRRLYLLSVLVSSPNVLFLDEPTNDLDVMTLSILEDYLQDFSGSIITVSHYRFFLDKMSASILEVCGDDRVVSYTGNWSDWNEKRTDTTDVPIRTPKAQPQQRQKKLKFSFKEEREFAAIDDDIVALEERLEENRKAQLLLRAFWSLVACSYFVFAIRLRSVTVWLFPREDVAKCPC